jgi:hypothetical protein
MIEAASKPLVLKIKRTCIFASGPLSFLVLLPSMEKSGLILKL